MYVDISTWLLLLHFSELYHFGPFCIQLDVRSSRNGVSRLQSEGKLNQAMAILPIPSSGPATDPTTNLNIGMDYWANTASSAPAIHGKATSTTVPGAVVPAEQWTQVCLLFILLCMHCVLHLFLALFLFAFLCTPYHLSTGLIFCNRGIDYKIYLCRINLVHEIEIKLLHKYIFY
jgi:hypothetical protein